MISTIDTIFLCFIAFLFGMLVGGLLGQYSVWRCIRKKGVVEIDDWKYIGERK